MTQSRRSFINSMLAFMLGFGKKKLPESLLRKKFASSVRRLNSGKLLPAISLAGLPGAGRGKPQEETGGKLATAMYRETAGQTVSDSGLVKLDAPDIAEDGAIVPITIESELPGVEAIWVFVEKNPSPLAARFDLEKNLDPFVSLRIKMNESSEVIAMVKSQDGYFSTVKKVKVVVGGCG